MHSLLVNSDNEIKITRVVEIRNFRMTRCHRVVRGGKHFTYYLVISDIKRLVLNLFCLTVQ